MSEIKAGYLRKSRQWKPVRLLDLAILLLHVHRGAKDKRVGFEDARETLDSLTQRLNKRVLVDPTLIESALWSANLLDELGEFEHPKGMSFDEFARKLCAPDSFNRSYNVIEKKGDR